MSDHKKLIEALLAAGHADLVARLQALQPSSPLEALLLRALTDALRDNGLAGAQAVYIQLLQVIEGEAAELDLADLKLASDTLSALQRLEADSKNAVLDYLTKTAHHLVPLMRALLSLLVI